MNDFNFGLRLEQILSEKNIKTSDFCKETNTPLQRFYNWKNGSMPSVTVAYDIAKHLNMSVEELISGKSENPLQPIVDNLS